MGQKIQQPIFTPNGEPDTAKAHIPCKTCGRLVPIGQSDSISNYPHGVECDDCIPTE